MKVDENCQQIYAQYVRFVGNVQYVRTVYIFRFLNNEHKYLGDTHIWTQQINWDTWNSWNISLLASPEIKYSCFNGSDLSEFGWRLQCDYRVGSSKWCRMGLWLHPRNLKNRYQKMAIFKAVSSPKFQAIVFGYPCESLGVYTMLQPWDFKDMAKLLWLEVLSRV